MCVYQNGFLSIRNNRPSPSQVTVKMSASTKKTWASVVSGQPPKPKAPEEKKPKGLTQEEIRELLEWAERDGYDGCDAHDRIGCAQCAFEASGRCPSEKEE